MIYDFVPILLASGVTAALLIVAQAWMNGSRKRLPATWRYIIGALSIAIGTSVGIGIGLSQWDSSVYWLMAVIMPWFVPLPGGAIVLALNHFRLLENQADALRSKMEGGVKSVDANYNQERYSINGRNSSDYISRT